MSLGQRTFTSYPIALLVLGATSCMNLSEPVSAKYPILIGPVDHIGGQPTTLGDDDAPDFHLESDADVGICVETLGATFWVTKPSVLRMPGQVEASFAELAGKAPISRRVARAGSLRVGAYESFIVGCYSKSAWWRVNGHVVEVPR